jgi:fructose-1,6-bisphosphatase/inositol monophosphatase family enzyme
MTGLLELMRNSVVEAAVAAADNVKLAPNAEDGVVTETDLANSRRMRELGVKLRRHLPGLVQVDEESEKPAFAELFSASHVLATDGLDASRNFAGGLPFWGVSAGLLRGGEPVLGVVAVHHGDHLRVWSGGADVAPLIEVLDSAGILRYRHTPAPTPVWSATRLDLMPSANPEVQRVWDVEPGYLGFNPWGACARISMLAHVPALGGARAGGALDRSRLWDWAGLWAVLRRLAIEPYNLRTGAALRKLATDTLDPATWRLADDHVWATRENFDFIRSTVLKERPTR